MRVGAGWQKLFPLWGKVLALEVSGNLMDVSSELQFQEGIFVTEENKKNNRN